MINVLKNFPYLWVGVFLVFVVLLLYALFKRQRQMMLLNGVTHSAFFWMVFTLEGSYWTPVRVGGNSFGIEDFLVGFAAGGIAWFLVSLWPFLGRVRIRLVNREFWLRYFSFALVGILLYLSLCSTVLASMAVLILTFAIGVAVLLILRFDLWQLAIAGSFSFTILWFLIVKFAFLLWPCAAYQWNGASTWSSLVLGVPLGEIVWAASFGAFWPLFVAFLVKARFLRKAGSPYY